MDVISLAASTVKIAPLSLMFITGSSRAPQLCRCDNFCSLHDAYFLPVRQGSGLMRRIAASAQCAVREC